MEEQTTDLTIIKKTPRLFMWGKIVKIHAIGDRYVLVEYKRKGGEETSFSIYVDGASTSNSCSTLENALILAIAIGKIPECNQARHMASAASKLLDVG